MDKPPPTDSSFLRLVPTGVDAGRPPEEPTLSRLRHQRNGINLWFDALDENPHREEEWQQLENVCQWAKVQHSRDENGLTTYVSPWPHIYDFLELINGLAADAFLAAYQGAQYRPPTRYQDIIAAKKADSILTAMEDSWCGEQYPELLAVARQCVKQRFHDERRGLKIID